MKLDFWVFASRRGRAWMLALTLAHGLIGVDAASAQTTSLVGASGAPALGPEEAGDGEALDFVEAEQDESASGIPRRITLEAGDGGAAELGLPGAGGAARIDATRTSATADLLLLETRAGGGEGGNRWGAEGNGASAGDGGEGDATSRAETSAGALSSIARADGGDGGDAAYGASAGAGGDARADARGTGLDAASGRTEAAAIAEGGFGGATRSGGAAEGEAGRGGDATSSALATSTTDGEVRSYAWARGGEGGAGADDCGHLCTIDPGRGGAGGDAEATAIGIATVAGSGLVRVEAQAVGGGGGHSAGVGRTSRPGGGALASARAEAIDSDVEVVVVEQAGSNGRGLDGADGADGLDLVRSDRVSAATLGDVRLGQTTRAGSGGTTWTGRAGRGGDATSRLTRAAATSERDLVAELTAVGGFAGQSGLGEGNRGGDADATIDAIAAGSVSLTLEAIGGDASGRASAGRATFGHDDAAGVVGTSTGGGTVSIDAAARGGDGEDGFREGVDTGRGASVSLFDRLVADTRGGIRLAQHAIGGNGGDAVAARAGEGGDAFSHLVRIAPIGQQGLFRLSTTSTAGDGGDLRGPNGQAAPGGAAETVTDARSSDGLAWAEADSIGGAGGSGLGGADGGDGGGARAEAGARAGTTTDSRARARVTARGGAGGLVDGGPTARAGNGGGALAQGFTNARFDLSVDSSVEAIGGDGGSAAIGGAGSGGAGGRAVAELGALDDDASARGVRGEAVARGGSGGSGRGIGAAPGAGGAAAAHAAATIRAGSIAIGARAFGGQGGVSPDGSIGRVGDSVATAIGESGRGGVATRVEIVSPWDARSSAVRPRTAALARSLAAGPGGAAAELIARVAPSPIRGIRASASGASNEDAHRKRAEARLGVDPSVLPLRADERDGVVAEGIGLPDADGVRRRLVDGNETEVSRNFALDGRSALLGLGSLRLEPSASPVAANTRFEASLEFDIELAALDRRERLLVGLLDPVLEADTSLLAVDFRIFLEGRLVFDERIDDAEDVSGRLADRTLDLADLTTIATGPDRLLTLKLAIATTSIPASGSRTAFSIGLLVGSSTLGIASPIPEPSAATLVGLGLVLLCVVSPRRATARREGRHERARGSARV